MQESNRMMTTSVISPFSLTRAIPDMRKIRFGLIMAAAMVTMCFNYICETRFWVIWVATEDGLSREAITRYLPESKGLAYSWPTKRMREAICNEYKFGALRVPSFIIAGSQKAGTSALYELLSMHPQVVSSRKFEVHFFDFKMIKYRRLDPESVRDEVICERRRAYQYYFDYQLIQNMTEYGKVATFEKTPRYVCHAYIPGFIKRIVPWTKILIILRNPVERAFSQWKMDASRRAHDPTFPSFETSVSRTVKQLKDMGMSRAPTLEQFRDNNYTEEDFDFMANQTFLQRQMNVSNGTFFGPAKRRLLLEYIPRGFYAQQIASWLDYFKYGKDLKVIHYEKLQTDRRGVFRDILQFIDVDPDAWAMDDEVFKLDYRPVSLKGEKANQIMDNTTRAYLEKFYKPYNDELAELLGEDFRGIWDSSYMSLTSPQRNV